MVINAKRTKKNFSLQAKERPFMAVILYFRGKMSLSMQMVRVLTIIVLLLSAGKGLAQDENFFQDTILCNGKPILATFHKFNKKLKLASLGRGSYGKAGIDTLASGRIELPDSVTDSDGTRYKLRSIGRQGFANCRYITEITLPEGLTDIGDQAFYNCTSLREIVLPTSLFVIYPFAFRGCSSLRIIRLKATERVRIYDNIFDLQTLDNAILFIPAGTEKKYRNSLVFGMFRYYAESFE